MDILLISMIVLFVTSFANSGKMEQGEEEEFLDCSLDKDVFLFHNKSNIHWPRTDKDIVIKLDGNIFTLTLFYRSRGWREVPVAIGWVVLLEREWGVGKFAHIWQEFRPKIFLDFINV